MNKRDLLVLIACTFTVLAIIIMIVLSICNKIGDSNTIGKAMCGVIGITLFVTTILIIVKVIKESDDDE